MTSLMDHQTRETIGYSFSESTAAGVKQHGFYPYGASTLHIPPDPSSLFHLFSDTPTMVARLWASQVPTLPS